MVKIASIGANDETDGAKIWIGYERAEYDGEKGYRVVASNGDDIGYYRPQTKRKCIEDIYAMYDRWSTFQEEGK